MKSHVRVRAIQPFGDHKIGDEFDLSEQAARILSARDLLGGQKVSIVDRVMRSDDDASSLTPSKGRYSRRDMRAKE